MPPATPPTPSAVTLVELAALPIVALTFAFLARGGPWRPLLRDVLLLASAAWLGEVSCIRLYRFYQYDAPWSVFADVMPLAVAGIWPFVVLSSRAVVRAAWPGLTGGRLAAAVGLAVFIDASLIEPVAVAAGLWSWNEPGPFSVPLIGLCGWAFFAAAAVWALERWQGRARLAVLFVAPALTHVALLAVWWGALRWLPRLSSADTAVAVIALAASASATVAITRGGARKVDLSVMTPRLPAALLFGVLVLSFGADHPALLAYAAAFVPPYVALTRWRLSALAAR